jgi:trk system potassium uptake protein TrkH
MNGKLICKVIGILLFIEAGLMLLCMLVGLVACESVSQFVWPVLISAFLGSGLAFLGRNATVSMGRKDGYMIVSLTWIVYSLIGMLPFILSGVLPDVPSAFFETMSGFTSTGATGIDNCDIQPRSILFWRSLSQWVGGVGIIFFTIAILPAFGVGEVKLFAAESTGPFHDKVHPRISVTARWIGTVYILITVLCTVSLLICGMGLFDAVNFSFAVTATGGYATHSALLHDVYNSAAIEYVLTFFMFVSGINHTLIFYSVLKGKLRLLWRDAELRCYVIIAAGVTLICTFTLTAARVDLTHWPTEGLAGFLRSAELSFRESVFTVVSLQSTTGLASCDYTSWPVQLMPGILFVMFAGACSGSSSGGLKCIRWSIIWRIVCSEFKRILHPRAVIPIRLNGRVLPEQTIRTFFAFTSLLVGSLFIGAFILALVGVSADSPRTTFDWYEAFGIALSSISNVGPGMGYYGPLHSWSILSPVAKYTCSILMLIGRLEIFPIILIFTRGFWKKS